MRAVDMCGEPDMDALASIAYELAEKVRDDDPARVLSHLIGLCEQHPVKAAQTLMVLAIWFDPDTTTDVLWERVNGVARSRVKTATLGRTA